MDEHGKLVTESLRDYSRKTILKEYASLDEFLRSWNAADRKRAIIDEMESQGLAFDILGQEVNPELDAFDLICHVAYGQPPLTRKQRAAKVLKNGFFSKHGEEARAVLQALLDRYADAGQFDIEDPAVLHQKPFNEIGKPARNRPFVRRSRRLQTSHPRTRSLPLRRLIHDSHVTHRHHQVHPE